MSNLTISGPASIGVDTQALWDKGQAYQCVAERLSGVRQAIGASGRQAFYAMSVYPDASVELRAYLDGLGRLLHGYIDELRRSIVTFSDHLCSCSVAYAEADARARVAFLTSLWHPSGQSLTTTILDGLTMPFVVLSAAVDARQRLSGYHWAIAVRNPDGTCQLSNKVWGKWFMGPGVPMVCGQLQRGELQAATPHTPADLINLLNQKKIDDDRERIRVLEHRHPRKGGGYSSSYTVVVQGTSRWDIHGLDPQDMGSNFEAYSGWNSDAEEAVKVALEKTNIPAGAPVELIGHSQGGIVVGKLSADPAFTKKYHVVSAMTTGAPIARYQPVPQVNMLSFEHRSDVVSALDLQRNTTLPNHTTVRADIPAGVRRDPLNSHSLDFYERTAKDAQASGDLSVQMWMDNRNRKLGLDAPGTQTVVHDYAVFKTRIDFSDGRAK